jgi:uncharacterized protein
MTATITLLIFHGFLGGIDTVWNHEWKARLASTPNALPEQQVHALRGVLLTFFFAGLALVEWHGLWAWVLSLVILTEIILTLVDFVVEDRTRRLPEEERVLHGILGITGGAFITTLIPHLLEWSSRNSALIPVSYGWRTGILLAMSVGLLAFTIRDGLSIPRLRKEQGQRFHKQ